MYIYVYIHIYIYIYTSFFLTNAHPQAHIVSNWTLENVKPIHHVCSLEGFSVNEADYVFPEGEEFSETSTTHDILQVTRGSHL